MNEEWGHPTRVHPAVVDLWYLSERAKKLGINHFDRLGRKDACAAPPKSQRIAQMLNTHTYIRTAHSRRRSRDAKNQS